MEYGIVWLSQSFNHILCPYFLYFRLFLLYVWLFFFFCFVQCTCISTLVDELQNNYMLIQNRIILPRICIQVNPMHALNLIVLSFHNLHSSVFCYTTHTHLCSYMAVWCDTKIINFYFLQPKNTCDYFREPKPLWSSSDEEDYLYCYYFVRLCVCMVFVVC